MKKVLLFFLCIAGSVICHSQNQTILDVNVNDMVYDGSRNKLFALIGGTDKQYGNNLIQINCDTKKIEKNLFVGSSPMLLEITSDNNYLYIALSGSPKIVKVDINNFNINMQFPIGPIGTSVNIYAEDIATIPGNSNLLAVSRKEGSYVEDIVLFNNGVLLPDSVSNRELDATEIECNDTGMVLFGFNGANTGFNFGRMNINSDGLSYADDFRGVMEGFGLKMQYKDKLLYTNTGSAVNPNLSIPFKEGTFSGIENDSQLALNISVKESYFATFDFWSDAFRVRRYNTETYTLKDTKEFSLIFPETMSSPKLNEFICYGNNKFVTSSYESYFAEDNEKYIIFIDDIYSPFLSIDDETRQIDNIIIYPNPVAEVLTIEFGQNIAKSKIHITNAIGQIVYSKKVNKQNKIRINVSSYKSGLYFVKIISDRNVVSRRLIIN